MLIAWVSEATLGLASLQLVGIIYLALAISKLRERISKLEGKLESEHK